MRTDELDLPKEAIDSLIEQGFVELHPPQAEAIPKVLEGKSLVASIPTASGKSLIGYAAALKKILVERKRVLYIVPLKALASEKRDDFDRFSHLGISVGISIGDLDSDDRIHGILEREVLHIPHDGVFRVLLEPIDQLIWIDGKRR